MVVDAASRDYSDPLILLAARIAKQIHTLQQLSLQNWRRLCQIHSSISSGVWHLQADEELCAIGQLQGQQELTYPQFIVRG